MEVKVINPTHPLPFAQMGVSRQLMEDFFSVLQPDIDKHIAKGTPRALILQKIAALCDTTEQLLAALDIFYSYLYDHNAVYNRRL
jgi:hypothetical protein